VLPAEQAKAALDLLSTAGEKVYQVGVVRPRAEGEAHTIVRPAK
jgi:phosphoribosylformylglycinamidine cyclo-ligase